MVADGASTPARPWHSRGRGFDSLRLHSCDSSGPSQQMARLRVHRQLRGR